MTMTGVLLLLLSLATLINGEVTFLRENDPAYQQNFDQGYFPFDDFTEPSNETRGMLDRRDYCNRVFAEFLETEKLSVRLTPPDHPMKIAILFVVTNIYEVSEREQSVTITTFIELSWRDRRLADIGGNKCVNITKILPNLSQIFFPMFTIENSAERVLYEETWEKFPAVVYSQGVVVWITSLRLVLNCKMNMRIFPYDSQYYVYSRDSALLLWNENVSNPLWQLTGQMARLMTSTNISGIEIWFKLERKPSFYVWTLVIPTGIISLATCLSFTLPHDSGEKASENIPVLTLFFVIVIGLGMIGAIACAIIIRLHNKYVVTSAKLKKQGNNDNEEDEFAGKLNDVVLVIYSSSLAICYVGLFVYIEMAQREINDKIHSEFNYTAVQTFN